MLRHLPALLHINTFKVVPCFGPAFSCCRSALLGARGCSSHNDQRNLLKKARSRLSNKYCDREHFKPLKLKLSNVERVHLNDVFVRPFLTDKPRDFDVETRQEGSKISPIQPIYSDTRSKAKLFEIKEVFDDLKAGTRMGKTVLIVGPSGSGKTTSFTRRLPYDWAAEDDTSDCFRDTKLLLLVKDPDVAKAKTIRDLFQLQDLGLDDAEVGELEKFITNRVNPDDLCVIVDGLDNMHVECQDILWKIIERKGHGMFAYNLIITSRPCHQVDEFEKRHCFHRQLYLHGFTREDRDEFLSRYLKARGVENWEEVMEKHKNVLEAIDNFCDLVTRLPFITTLFGELLPQFDKSWKPKTRTELFERMIKQLINQEGKDKTISEKQVQSGSYKTALQLIGELALEDLCSDEPSHSFSDVQLTRKVKGSESIEEEVNRIRRALVEAIPKEKDGETVLSFVFLDASVQEYLAARAFSSLLHVNNTGMLIKRIRSLRLLPASVKEYLTQYMLSSLLHVSVPSRLAANRLETFWLFLAGSSSGSENLSLVFSKMIACHKSAKHQNQPGISETVLAMLEEAFPFSTEKQAEKIRLQHAALLHDVARFLDGHLYYGRRWAIQKRPFWSVGHALQLLPNVQKVTVFSRSKPAEDAFLWFVKGLNKQRKSLVKVKLFSKHAEADAGAKPSDIASQLVKFLQQTTSLEVFRCDWQLPDDAMQRLCREGIACCKKLWDVGLSLHKVNEQTVLCFANVVQNHPYVVSMNIGDIDPALPKPISKLLADKKCKVGRFNILINNASEEMLQSLSKAISKNRSLSSVGLLTSNYHFEGGKIDTLWHRYHVTKLGKAVRKHPNISRVVIETEAFCLDYDCFFAMMQELLWDKDTAEGMENTPIKQLKVICTQAISENVAEQFRKLVKNNKYLELVSTRRQTAEGEERGIFTDNIPAWYPADHQLKPSVDQKPADPEQWRNLARMVASGTLVLALAVYIVYRLWPDTRYERNSLIDDRGVRPKEQSECSEGAAPSTPTPGSTDQMSKVSEVIADTVGARGRCLATAVDTISIENKPTAPDTLWPLLLTALGHFLTMSLPIVRSTISSWLNEEEEESTGDNSLQDDGDHVADGSREGSLMMQGVSGGLHPTSAVPCSAPGGQLSTQAASQEEQPSPNHVPVHGQPMDEGEDVVVPRTNRQHGIAATQVEESATQDEELFQPGPVPVYDQPMELPPQEMEDLYGAEADRVEVVHRAALYSPFLPALRHHIKFFVYQLQLTAILDRMLESDVFTSSSDVFQAIQKEGLYLNQRRRLLFFYALGSLPFSGFGRFLLAVKDVHGESHEDVLNTVEEGLLQSCRTFIAAHCASLEVESAGRILRRLHAQDLTPAAVHDDQTPVQALFLEWLNENSTATAFPDLLQAMVDEGCIQHPSAQALSQITARLSGVQERHFASPALPRPTGYTRPPKSAFGGTAPTGTTASQEQIQQQSALEIEVVAPQRGSISELIVNERDCPYKSAEIVTAVVADKHTELKAGDVSITYPPASFPSSTPVEMMVAFLMSGFKLAGGVSLSPQVTVGWCGADELSSPVEVSIPLHVSEGNAVLVKRSETECTQPSAWKDELQSDYTLHDGKVLVKTTGNAIYQAFAGPADALQRVRIEDDVLNFSLFERNNQVGKLLLLQCTDWKGSCVDPQVLSAGEPFRQLGSTVTVRCPPCTYLQLTVDSRYKDRNRIIQHLIACPTAKPFLPIEPPTKFMGRISPQQPVAGTERSHDIEVSKMWQWTVEPENSFDDCGRGQLLLQAGTLKVDPVDETSIGAVASPPEEEILFQLIGSPSRLFTFTLSWTDTEVSKPAMQPLCPKRKLRSDQQPHGWLLNSSDIGIFDQLALSDFQLQHFASLLLNNSDYDFKGSHTPQEKMQAILTDWIEHAPTNCYSGDLKDVLSRMERRGIIRELNLDGL